MIDVTEILMDPDFVTDFTVIRTTGNWVEGEFVLDEPIEIPMRYPVQPASIRELEQMPEGDRQKGIVKFFCVQPDMFYLTRFASDWRNSDEGGISDEIRYRGNLYKLIQIMPWDANGFQRAFGYLKEMG